jgi:hypothetical protein
MIFLSLGSFNLMIVPTDFVTSLVLTDLILLLLFFVIVLKKSVARGFISMYLCSGGV